jgi:hypothetical protein
MHRDLGDPKVYRHATIDPSVAHVWRQQYSERFLDAPTRALMTRWGIA